VTSFLLRDTSRPSGADEPSPRPLDKPSRGALYVSGVGLRGPLSPTQRDTLDTLARRLHTASLAVNALGADPAHAAVADTVLNAAYQLEALTPPAGDARRVVARRRIG
jgi:hypothetical protein